MAWIDADGSALQPPFGFESEQSLGLFRSGTSHLAQSYGTFGVSALSVDNTVRFTSTSGLTIQPTTSTYAGSGNLVALSDGSASQLLQYRTDGRLKSITTPANGFALDVSVSGDANARFQVQNTGKVLWGNGTNSPEVFLTRSASSTLQLSVGTFDLQTSYLASVHTATSISSAVLGTNAWAVANPAVSGASICININGVMYIFNSSATTIGR